MTVKDAKKKLNIALEILSSPAWDDDTRDCNFERMLEALLLKIRQATPTKPKIIKEAVIYKCPKCGTIVDYGQGCCYYCTQKLDFRGIENDS